MRLSLLLLAYAQLFAITIIDRPIIFDKTRLKLTQEYIKTHYGIVSDTGMITPKILVIHWTSINGFERSYQRFVNSRLPSDRPDIQEASGLNVSAHFLVDRDGTIYRLMDETVMARHVIGLNLSAIGIENVGGEGNRENLTQAQLEANLKLIRYLQKKYPSIQYLIAHYEYTRFQDHPLWLERQKNYRTVKYDPGASFMKQLRHQVTNLQGAP